MCFRTKVSILLLTLFIGAGVFSMNVQPAEAASLDELQQIITELKIKIAELQIKLKLARQGITEPAEWCHTFNKNLKYGNASAEVIALQTALKKQGFKEAGKDKRGTFGMFTSSAVVGFQEKYKKDILAEYGLTHGTGFVGRTTRAKLNQLYRCEALQCAKEGEQVNRNPLMGPIDMQCCEGLVENRVSKSYSVCEKPVISPYRECNAMCQAKGYHSGICREWVVVPDTEWGCKDDELNIGQTSDCTTVTTTTDGMQEEIVGVGKTCCCQKEGTGANLPPVIDGTTAPTQLKVNEKGVWTIKAHDPENGALSYSVTWGDEYAKIALPESAPAEMDTRTQTTTFTHSYSQVGIYTIRFTVTDDNQQTAKTSTTIKIVSETTTTCTDSDGGINKYVKGRACRDLYSIDNSSPTGTSSASRFCRTDRCIPSPDGYIGTDMQRYLTEYYCSNGRIYSKTMYCENGCVDGACKRDGTTCTDTDGGKDYYTKGTATGFFPATPSSPTTANDFCLGGPQDLQSNILVEYYCGVDRYIYSTHYTCPNGCENGACVKGNEPYCSAIGSRSEGWYENGGLIGYENCAGCYAVCKAIGSKSEGWYSSGECETSGKLIKYENCGEGQEEPSITVTSPNGGETFRTGEMVNITWDSSNFSADDSVKVILYYKHNDPTYSGGQIWEDWIAENVSNIGSYFWTIPEYYAQGIEEDSFSVGVRLSSGLSDFSDGKFTILAGTLVTDITVTSPVTGVSYVQEDSVQIDWTPKNINETYMLSLLRASDPSFLRLSGFTGSISNLAWNVPSDISPGDDYYIRVNQDGRQKTGYSGLFSIIASNETTCTDTDGGRNYYVKGNTIGHDGRTDSSYTGHNVWDKCLTDMERLTEWYCENSLIKSEVIKCHNGCDNGACKPDITVTSPNGGEQFYQGDSYTITWRSSGSIDNVRIVICMTPESYAQSAPSESRCDIGIITDNDGIYSNQFGQAAAIGNYIVKIEDASDATVYDESDDYFSIKKHPNTIDNATDCIVNGYYWGPNGCYAGY